MLVKKIILPCCNDQRLACDIRSGSRGPWWLYFLLFLAVDCVFGVGVAAGCLESHVSSDNLNKGLIKYRLRFSFEITPTYVGLLY